MNISSNSINLKGFGDIFCDGLLESICDGDGENEKANALRSKRFRIKPINKNSSIKKYFKRN